MCPYAPEHIPSELSDRQLDTAFAKVASVRGVGGGGRGGGNGGGGDGREGGGEGATHEFLIVSQELAGPVMGSLHTNLAWKAVVPSNMSVCAVDAAVPVHEEMSWLNAEAEVNIYCISVTCDVFQLPMSWLNAEAE